MYAASQLLLVCVRFIPNVKIEGNEMCGSEKRMSQRMSEGRKAQHFSITLQSRSEIEGEAKQDFGTRNHREVRTGKDPSLHPYARDKEMADRIKDRAFLLHSIWLQRREDAHRRHPLIDPSVRVSLTTGR